MKTTFYTGRGDDGVTHFGNQNISKDSLLFEVLGGLDELNSWLGMCRVEAGQLTTRNLQLTTTDSRLKSKDTGSKLGEKSIRSDVDIAAHILFLQECVFILQAEVAGVGFGYESNVLVREEKIGMMESAIQEIDLFISPIRKFIIPGGSELSARLDVARTVARKLERDLVRFSKEKVLRKEVLQFVNRLSSFLFALARYANWKAGIEEESPRYE